MKNTSTPQTALDLFNKLDPIFTSYLGLGLVMKATTSTERPFDTSVWPAETWSWAETSHVRGNLDRIGKYSGYLKMKPGISFYELYFPDHEVKFVLRDSSNKNRIQCFHWRTDCSVRFNHFNLRNESTSSGSVRHLWSISSLSSFERRLAEIMVRTIHSA